MKNGRSDTLIAAAIGTLMLAAAVMGYAAFGAKPADRKDTGLDSRDASVPGGQTLKMSPGASMADVSVAANPPAPPARPEPQPHWTASAVGTLASHGGGVLVQAAPTSGVGRELDLAEGDRIVRINGSAVTQASDVVTMLTKLPPHGKIRIDGIRNGKPISLYYSGNGTPATQE